jgi:hypothetical protein
VNGRLPNSRRPSSGVSSVKVTPNEAHANCRTDDDRPYSVGQHDRPGVQQKLHDRHRDQKHQTPPEMLLQQEPAENRAMRAPSGDLAGGPHRDGLVRCACRHGTRKRSRPIDRVVQATYRRILPMVPPGGFAAMSSNPIRRATGLAFLSLAALITVPATATATSSASLPTCQHFYQGTIPDRPVSGGHGPGHRSRRLQRQHPATGTRRGHRRAQQRRQGDVHLQPRAGRGGLPHVPQRPGPAMDQRLGARRVSWSPTPARARTPTTRFTR